MIHSRITGRARTTIPEPVRAALGLREGDDLVYEIDGAHVVLRRREATGAADDPFAGFAEWDGEADRRAYAGF